MLAALDVGAERSSRWVMHLAPSTAAPVPPADLAAAAVARLYAKQVRLPPYPAVAAELQRAVASQRCTIDTLATLVGSDTALAATVLSRARSVVYGTAPHQMSLATAIGRIGIDEVIWLAVTASVAQVVAAPGPLAEVRRDVWRRSLTTARLAQELAPSRGVVPGDGYLAGLLHDIGAVVVLACIEDLAADQPLPAMPAAAWAALVDGLHVEFGAVLAARWDLPPAIVAVIRDHHAPPDGPHAALVALVASCDAIVAALDRAPPGSIDELAVPGVTAAELARLSSVMAEVVEQMVAFEPSTRTGRSAVVAAAVPQDGWPVDFEVTGRRGTYRARRLTANDLELVGAMPLPTNWLTELTVHAGTSREAQQPPMDLLFNVTRCELRAEGGHEIWVRPYALGGAHKQRWAQLVDDVRRR